MASPELTVVIPLYRSEKTIGPLVERLLSVLTSRYVDLEVVLVNDGSPDRTHQRALDLVRRYRPNIRYFRLSRNFGEHNAVMCGLKHARGRFIAVIDDDFQNPPEEIPQLIEKLNDGYDVVYGRYSVKQHHWARNVGSRFANAVASRLLGKPKDLYLSSFKAMNSFLAKTIAHYNGPFPYIDGLILRSTELITSVEVRHEARREGRSNYTFGRLFHLWLNMFTGFSIVPLRAASFLGFAMSAVGFLMAIFFILSWRFEGILIEQPIPPGWASLIVTIVIFAGLQLSVLGMLGEYLGRLFLSESGEPQYIVREAHGLDEESGDKLEVEKG